MSVKQNKASEQRLYDEEWNKGNLSLIPELVSPDYVSGDNKGHEGYRRLVNFFREPMPDLHFTIDEIVGEGDKVFYRVSGTGTYTGKVQGVDVKGKKLSWTQAIFTEWKNGKVAKALSLQDTVQVFRQLGVAPPGYEIAKK